jgi:hypothetical protein
MRIKLNGTEPPEDEGTVVLFPGQVMGGALDGLSVRVVSDHRHARPIAEALAQGVEVEVNVEAWQVMM